MQAARTGGRRHAGRRANSATRMLVTTKASSARHGQRANQGKKTVHETCDPTHPFYPEQSPKGGTPQYHLLAWVARPEYPVATKAGARFAPGRCCMSHLYVRCHCTPSGAVRSRAGPVVTKVRARFIHRAALRCKPARQVPRGPPTRIGPGAFFPYCARRGFVGRVRGVPNERDPSVI
jgi:hypothetical protein